MSRTSIIVYQAPVNLLRLLRLYGDNDVSRINVSGVRWRFFLTDTHKLHCIPPRSLPLCLSFSLISLVYSFRHDTSTDMNYENAYLPHLDAQYLTLEFAWQIGKEGGLNLPTGFDPD